MTEGCLCDRCGNFESGQRRSSNRDCAARNPDKRTITFGHRTGDSNTGSRTRTVDLCEPCRQALSDWIDRREDGDTT